MILLNRSAKRVKTKPTAEGKFSHGIPRIRRRRGKIRRARRRCEKVEVRRNQLEEVDEEEGKTQGVDHVSMGG